MPIKLIENASFIRPAEIMGADIQAALTMKADEVAGLVAEGIKGKKKSPLNEARALVRKTYSESGLDEKNRARLVRVLNRGADEVSDSSLLKRQKGRITGILDNLGGVVQKSAEDYLDRIVLKKVGRVVANGGSPEDIRIAVAKSMEDAEHYWKNVSNTATSRAYHYGGMLAAEGSGLKKCTYLAVIDDATTDFCRSIDGKTITLANAIVKAEAVLEQSPEDMMNTDFWAIANDLAELGSKAMVTSGLTLPPFHGHCRTTIHFH